MSVAPFDLRGKIALVAGGSRGLGLVLARQLAKRGARLALVARDAAELERATLDLRGRGAQEVVCVTADLTVEGEGARAVAEVSGALGDVQVLANVAGDIEVGPLDAMDMNDFRRAMATNLWGPFELVRAVIPGMRARGGGRILNVSSVGGVVAVPHLLPYSTSKFAMTGLSFGLRTELARHGIAVTTACPGLMRTGSAVSALFKGDVEAEFAWFATAASLPFVTASAERAAKRMIRAVVRGEAVVFVPFVARLAALSQAFAPRLVAAAMQLVQRTLPLSGSSLGLSGRVARSPGLSRWLTLLGDRAALRNNED